MNYNFKCSSQDGLIEKMAGEEMLGGGQVRVSQAHISRQISGGKHSK